MKPSSVASTLVLAVATAGAIVAGCASSPPAERKALEATTTTTTSTSELTPTTTSAPLTLRDRTLVGAYYYLWNPENLTQGWLRGALDPPQPDASAQAAAPDRGASVDIDQASSNGIDFFAVNWWPNRDEQNRRLDTTLLAAPNLDRMRFSIFYEVQDLDHDVATGTTRLDPAKIRALAADVTDLARRYFGHPQYLRVDGRPVLVLYLTRTMVGDVAGAVTAVREAARAEGFEVLLVGDEVYWQVAPLGPSRRRPVQAPQVARAQLFDAITAYNLYDPGKPAQAGYGSTTTFLADSRRLYDTYRFATGGRVPVVPSVLPGFNDRGVRPRLRHSVVPRQWAPGDADATFLARALDDVAIPLIDERLPMVLVTTWNEWNEDTAIEPVAVTEPTAADTSRTRRAITDGYAYAGHGTAYLDVIRQRFGP